VFSTLTFHHWSGRQAGIAEVARVLTPRGRWLLADFIVGGWMRPLKVLLRIHAPTRGQLSALLRGAGLEVKETGRLRRFSGQLPVLAIGRVSR
jgi:ubiquinone/menaquinone biosynthesis C-methylase UbiE